MNKTKAPKLNCSRLLDVSQYPSAPSLSKRKLLKFSWAPQLTRIKTIPAARPARCGHMVKSWPIRCENNALCWTSGKCP